MFDGWDEHPPTNLIVKAIAEGFGAKFKDQVTVDEGGLQIPPSATFAMQQSAAEAIATKAGGRLPMLRGKDPGLPTTLPVFDMDELRKRNIDVLVTRIKARDQPNV